MTGPSFGALFGRISKDGGDCWEPEPDAGPSLSELCADFRRKHKKNVKNALNRCHSENDIETLSGKDLIYLNPCRVS